MTELLLISNSTLHGSGYLDHCAGEITSFLRERKNIVFIPYARPNGISHEAYTKIARERYKKMGFSLKGIHEYTSPNHAVDDADAFFTGGGNTFVLLTMLYKTGAFSLVQQAVKNGIPYIGTSAGSNIACKSIQTTNDMPIMYPPTFDAFGFVSFNINPHYLDPDPTSTHMGETRETRINEFLIHNTLSVVGLREGAMLHISNEKIILKGTTGARVFFKDGSQKEYKPVNEIKGL
jgi:dipeptidase E